MNEFKPTIKMKCGGSVSKAVAKAKGGVVEKTTSDLKQDKKIVKKALNLHDDQLHEGAKTDLSTLKKGGRCKKTGGTVRKYAAGGLTEMLERGKKRPRPVEPPGGVEPDDVPRAPEQAYKKGGKVKKMAIGGLTDPTTQAVVNADVLRRRKAAQMGAGAGGLAAPNAVPGATQGVPAQAPTAPVGQPMTPDLGTQPPAPVMKRGGKVKKGCK